MESTLDLCILPAYTSQMDLVPEYFPGITGFAWDEGNSEKNRLQHHVTRAESGQVFLNRPLLVVQSPGHSGGELRYFALGRTGPGRPLAIAFVLRGALLRVISSQPMN
jgi:uncharacterized DUF497 family protein